MTKKADPYNFRAMNWMFQRDSKPLKIAGLENRRYVDNRLLDRRLKEDLKEVWD